MAAPSGRAPSGEQFELAHGEHRATVVEVGGGVRTYDVGGVSVLDGYGVDEICDGARGQTLVPWPNRIAGGAYTFDGRSFQLPLTEPARGNAIHGLARWRPWTVVDRSPASVTLGCAIHPRDGYPFALDVHNTVTLDDGGLTVTTTASNVGSDPAPFALGFHPYLTIGDGRIDDLVLEVPAATYLPTDEQGIPTGREPVDGTRFDFRTARRIGATEIDVAFTDLVRDRDGRASTTLREPDGDRAVTLWVDATHPYVEVFTGDTLAAPRRRRGLGLEPMTAPPNAFVTGEDLRTLPPGGSTTHRWGVTAAGW